MARTTDVTDRLLADVHGPGDRLKRVRETKAPRTSSPSLTNFFTAWEQRGANTIGHISHALAYGSAMKGDRASDHKNMVRLVKAGHIRACEVNEPPPAGTAAKRDSPYGTKFYYLAVGSCPDDLDTARVSLRGASRRRR